MKYLSFRILAICILYPPILYVLSIQYIEGYLTTQYQQQLEQVAVGDVQPLFAGTADIETVVPRNIQRFLDKQGLADWGVDIKVTVTTQSGQVLFPPPYESFEPGISPANPADLAAENYEILNEGLHMAVEVELPHNRLLSNLLLGALILSSLLILYLYVASGARKAKRDEQQQEEELRRLEQLKIESTEKLASLESEHQALTSRFSAARADLENQRRQTNKNEDEFIQEIEGLEQKLQENLAFQEEQVGEIKALKEKIQSFEKDRRRVSQLKKRGVEEAKKRFQTLYKRLSVNDRAVEDFVDLADEFKLKAEEVIFQLNENADQVTVKRKVFTKKSREKVFEVAFGYRGRLYFRRLADGRVEVLTIGNKNKQARNLEFIEKL